MSLSTFLASPQGKVAVQKMMAQNKGRQSQHSGTGMKYADQAQGYANMNGLLSGMNAMGGGQQPNRQMTAQPQMNQYLQSLLSM